MKIATHRIPGLVLSDHRFSIPLEHSKPDGPAIELFAREVVAPAREHDTLPWLLFLQGGPGSPSPRPLGRDGWLKRALQEYRVLLLDQRGTGRSTPVTVQGLARMETPQVMADYLKQFRADAIVRDAEWIRRELLGADERWSILGQSYGGFVAMSYLSTAPDGLREAIMTGGLAPVERPAEDVYRATYRRVLSKNRAFYERYPDDVERAQQIADTLTQREVMLPGGDRLSSRRFQQLGSLFGANDGMETLHYLLEEPVDEEPGGPLPSYTFLRAVENTHHFDTNPIYAILHEAIYTQQSASRWAAQRVRSEYPEFELRPGQPVYFTGEMIYPWLFDEWRALRPLKQAAEILAAADDWPMLYDAAALRANRVPCVAAIYMDDMSVERAYSEESAQMIRGLRPWITNQYHHNAIRYDGEAVLGRLLGMLHGEG